MRSYSTDNLSLAYHGVLLDIAVEQGLDRQETAAILSAIDYADAMREDEAVAHRIGIRACPFSSRPVGTRSLTPALPSSC